MLALFDASKDKVIPEGTRMRTIYDLFVKSLKTLVFEGWASFATKAKYKLNFMEKAADGRIYQLSLDKMFHQPTTGDNHGMDLKSSPPDFGLVFRNFGAYKTFESTTWRLRRYIEQEMSKHESIKGYCQLCDKVQSFVVNGGATFGNEPNLREGMLCECGLNNRTRLLLHYIIRVLKSVPANDQKACFFEYDTPMIGKFSEITHLKCFMSKFGINKNDPDFQDMTATSYSNDFFDLVVHSDVLEHVPDHMKGLQECYRILKKDGYLIFTTPFFGIQLTVVRAVLQDNGNILHLRPASYHGDPLNPAGILAYYDFGWSLYEDLTKTGFTDVTICVNYDPFSGFVSNNHPCPNISEKDNDYGDMLPLVFVCRK